MSWRRNYFSDPTRRSYAEPTTMPSLLLGTAVLGFGQNPAPMPKRDPERHPHIRAAMADLRKAANQLEHADNDYGGHRAKAGALVKQTEDELREAIAWAKAHPDSD